MPPATLTSEQTAAVAARDVSVALSAGAGCGKTHVLTARFLSHLDPRGPDGPEVARLGQLVAITFTDAAAREMRTRIRSACHARLREDGLRPEEHGQWLALWREIDTARVSTIHAFCAALLRTHATDAGLDPNFGVLEQSAADVLQYQVIDDVLRTQLADRDPHTLDLAAAFGLSPFKERLAALLKRRHTPAFSRWHAVSAEDVKTQMDVMLGCWREQYKRDSFRIKVREIADKAPCREMLQMLKRARPSAGNLKFGSAIAELLRLLPRLTEGKVDESELEVINQAARVQSICSETDWDTSAEYAAYKEICKQMRGAVQGRPPEWSDAVAREAATLGLKLLSVTHKVADAYERRKESLGKLDFDDLLSYAKRLLEHRPAIGQQLVDELRLVLVDEFQDTDELQVSLIKSVCGEALDAGRLFFVGDFKQSIYRFRGAQPDVFRQLRNEVKKRGQKQLRLTKNFRSQPGILQFVNALFHEAFAKEYEPLRPHREQVSAEPAVEFLWQIAPDKDSHQKGAAEAARRQEARAIAGRLRALLDENSDERPIVDRDAGEPRRARPGDVAILFRALSDVQLYEEALREQGLDYYLVGGHAFYSQQEIFDVLNLLRAVASSADEISLAGALRSPFFSLADETLFWLAEAGEEKQGAGNGEQGVGRSRLNAGLLAERLPDELPEEERVKVVAAATAIRHLREIKDRVPIVTLLAEALSRTGYDAVLLAEFLGERKLANLQKLFEQARAADSGGTLDLDGFITQLTHFTSEQPKEALAATSPETDNVIRLMTIHQAKGLEFPLVIVADLDRRPLITPPPAALNDELGPLVSLPSDENSERAATGMSLFVAGERQEELRERERLLYVACTRAADHLILSSSLESCDKPVSDWMKLIAGRFNLENGELVAELPEGYERPRVRRTNSPNDDGAAAGRRRSHVLLPMIETALQLATEGQSGAPPGIEPIPVDGAARRWFSFSRLTGRLVRPDSPRWISPAEPADGESDMVDPRRLGSLVHAVLERVDFAAADATASVESWCELLAPEHVLENVEQAAGMAGEMIGRLVASPRGRQLAAAAEMHRELEFLLTWPPSTARQSRSTTPGHGFLRGFFDCLYRGSDDKWRLLDYKTNEVAAGQSAAAAQRYEMQIYVYALAAEQALGAPLAELALCFLRPGVEYVFPWNDGARRRCVELVQDAMVGLIADGSALNDF